MANITEILRGLELIEKYEPGGNLAFVEAQMFAGGEDAVEEMSPEDCRIMTQNGWFVYEGMYPCWSHYIIGHESEATGN